MTEQHGQKPLVPHRASWGPHGPRGWWVLVAAGTIGQPLAHTAPLMLLTALGSWHWCPHFATEDTIWGACLGSGDQGVLGPEPQGPTGPQPPLHACPCLGWPPPTSRSFTGARSSPGCALATDGRLPSSVAGVEFKPQRRPGQVQLHSVSDLASSSVLQGRPGLDLLTPTCVPSHRVCDQGTPLKAAGNTAYADPRSAPGTTLSSSPHTQIHTGLGFSR